MKNFLIILTAFIGLSPLANASHLDDSRLREIEARNRMLNGPGYLVPGPRPERPPVFPGYPHRPPMPPPAYPDYPDHGGYPYPGQPNPYPAPYPPAPYPYPPAPDYNNVYGPAVTLRWQNMGSFKAQKLVDTDIELGVYGQLVNEVYLVAEKNNIMIRSALAYLSNGQIIEIRGLLGNLDDGRGIRVPLDYRNSLRVDRIVLNIEAGNLIGSRGTLHVQLGLAQ